jgi:hypothetical protein
MQVFSVFKLLNGGDIYDLLCICSTQEKALEVIKTAALNDLNSSLKFYIEELHSTVSNPFDDYLFCEAYKQLRDILYETELILQDVFNSYFWVSCQIDETFDIKHKKHFQGPFELSKEQKDEIESVLENKLYRGRFEQIQIKKLEELKYPNPRKFKTLQM